MINSKPKLKKIKPHFVESNFYKLELFLVAVNFVFALFGYLGSTYSVSPYLVNICWLLAYLGGGWMAFVESFKALIKFSLNIDILMLLAALGAWFIGNPFEGAALLFLFSLSSALEDYTLTKTKGTIAKLYELRPHEVNIKKNGAWKTVDLDDVAVGDICLIRPGENVPFDGKVVGGESDVDQSSITGESEPVFKKTGDKLLAGVSNKTGALELKVSALFEDSSLAKIIHMVEAAQSRKSKFQSRVEKFEKYYAGLVLSLIFFLSLFAIFVLGSDSYNTFYKSLNWLVVVSPCALVISSPVTVLSTIAAAAKGGILFKGGISVELAATIKAVAFDKTGTLTKGQHELVYHYCPDIAFKDIISNIAALEIKSEHVLAKAVTNFAKAHNISYQKLAVQNFKIIPGKGLIGKVADATYLVGNSKLLADYDTKIPENFKKAIFEAAEKSLSIGLVAVHQGESRVKASKIPTKGYRILAVLGFSDQIRPQAFNVVNNLKKIGIDETTMLTGDNQKSASIVAKKIGIKHVYSELLPQDKLNIISKMALKKSVAMVGDGVNDAPSLTSASVGISMGKGASDVALETADVVLMTSNLDKISLLIKLAKNCRKIVRQNLAFSLFMILLLSAFNLADKLNLVWAVAAHEGSTLIVIINGLRPFMLAVKKNYSKK